MEDFLQIWKGSKIGNVNKNKRKSIIGNVNNLWNRRCSTSSVYYNNNYEDATYFYFFCYIFLKICYHGNNIFVNIILEQKIKPINFFRDQMNLN